MRILLLPLRILYTIYVVLLVCATSAGTGLLYRLVVIPFVPRWRYRLPRLWGWITCSAITRWEMRGLEHFPDGPCAVFANHASFLDIPLLQALPRHTRFVAKRLFMALPAFRTVIRYRGDIVLDKGAGGANQNSRAMLKAIEAGCGVQALQNWRREDPLRTLVVYAEGTRSRDGKLRPFRTRNIARHLIRAGIPVVPAAIEGSYRVWPPGRFLFDFSRVRVTFAPPVTADTVDALLERTHAAVAARLERAGATDAAG